MAKDLDQKAVLSVIAAAASDVMIACRTALAAHRHVAERLGPVGGAKRDSSSCDKANRG